jgi:hypothetical protein
MITIVRLLQLGSALAWAVPLLLHWPSAWRVLKGTSRGEDLSWTFVCFNSLMQIGFVIRWFVWRDAMRSMEAGELATWSALYLLSGLVAGGTFWVITARGKERR